jgi:hypothetical protein
MQRKCFRDSTHANCLGQSWQQRLINPMHLMASDGGLDPNVISSDTQVYIMYVCRRPSQLLEGTNF